MKGARAVRAGFGLVVLVLAVLLALYGLFAILYNGDGGNTYVTIAGHEVDADLVGAIALVIGLFAAAFSLTVLRRGHA